MIPALAAAARNTRSAAGRRPEQVASFLPRPGLFCCNGPVTGSPSPYERLGGEVGLEKIVDDFIDRVTRDMMIGFFFRTIDRDRLKRLETQFAASHLGGPSRYEGRPLDVAHGSHPIMGGQFNRRLRILDQTLRDHGVSDDIREEWLRHNESLRHRITRDRSDECNDPLSVQSPDEKGNSR